MSHPPFGRFILGLTFCFLAVFASAQEVSPYSRYGLGDVGSTDFSPSRAMGGLSASYRNPFEPNYTNPATYSSVALTTLTGGFKFSTKSLNLKDTSFTTGDGFIDYLSITLPAAKARGAVSFGLVPFSQMNYNFSQSVTNDTTGAYNRLFNGSGRLYKLYIGGGFQVIGKSDTAKHRLSIGMNGNFLFGHQRYSEIINFPDSVNALNTRKNLETHVADFVLDLGAQWVIRLSKVDSAVITRRKPPVLLTIGAYASVPTNRASSIDATYDRLLSTNGSLSVIDTLSYSTNTKQKLNIPPKLGLGLSIGKGFYWTVGVDASYTLWSKFMDINEPTLKLHNALRLAVGGEVCPSPAGRSFLKRAFYRLGGYYDGGYLTLNGQNVKEYGITFGFGLPMLAEDKAFSRTFPYINFSFDLGSRGTNAGDLITEKFFRGTISLTLNSKWFIKALYD